MGEASGRKEIAARLRREIGDKAAAAVGELREFLDQTNKNHRALASGLAQADLRIDKALAAPADLRRRVDELAEQLEAMRLRVDSLTSATAGELAFYNALDLRVRTLEGWQSARTLHQSSIAYARLIDVEMSVFDERQALIDGRGWSLPWRRRRRLVELSRYLETLTALRTALGIALPTQRAEAGQ